MNPSWDCKYTTNINLQMNYWLTDSANLTELYGNFDMIWDHFMYFPALCHHITRRVPLSTLSHLPRFLTLGRNQRKLCPVPSIPRIIRLINSTV